MNTLKLTFLFSVAILFSACGSGGGGSNDSGSTTVDISGQSISGFTGSKSSATVSADNQEAISTATAVAAVQITKGKSGAAQNPFGAPVSSGEKTIAYKAFANAAELLRQKQLPIAFKDSEPCTNGGSMNYNFPGVSKNAQSAPESGTFEVLFNNCKEGTTIIDGYFVMEYNGGWDIDGDEGPRNFTYTFDVSTSSDNFSYDSSGSVTCTNYGESCSFGDNFVEGGVSYRVETNSIEQFGDEYDIDAKVYAGDEGYVYFVATGIIINDDGVCAGTIEVIDSEGAVILSVTFPDCDTMVVVFDGVATTYNQ